MTDEGAPVAPGARPSSAIPAWAACAALATLGFGLVAAAQIQVVFGVFSTPLSTGWATFGDVLEPLGYAVLAGALAAALVAAGRGARWLLPALWVALAAEVLHLLSAAVNVSEEVALVHRDGNFAFLAVFNTTSVLLVLSEGTLATAATLALLATFPATGADDARRRWRAPLVLLAAGFGLEAISGLAQLVVVNWSPTDLQSRVWLYQGTSGAALLLLAAALFCGWGVSWRARQGRDVASGLPVAAVGLVLLAAAAIVTGAAYGGAGPLLTLFRWETVLTLVGQSLQAVAAVVILGALLGRLGGAARIGAPVPSVAAIPDLPG